MTLRTIANLLASAVIAACAQTAAPPPSFEVASIKGIPPSSPAYLYFGTTCKNDPAQLTCQSITLRFLILRAYGLRSYQLASPVPIDRDKYDIVAKIPPSSAKEQIDLMLQNLLVERFGLAVHWETRDLPIYELVVTKGGPKLKDPEKPQADLALPGRAANGRAPAMVGSDGLPVLPPGIPGMRSFPMAPSVRISARMQPVAALLGRLEGEIGRPVIDKTGLSGIYDFSLFYTPDSTRVIFGRRPGETEPSTGQSDPLDAANESGPPDLLAAFRSQLGLELKPGKSPFKVLVVDKVNRMPTEN